MLSREWHNKIPVCARTMFEKPWIRSTGVRQLGHNPHRTETFESFADAIFRQKALERIANFRRLDNIHVELDDRHRDGQDEVIAVERLRPFGDHAEVIHDPSDIILFPSYVFRTMLGSRLEGAK
jgi:hypothetical protein